MTQFEQTYSKIDSYEIPDEVKSEIKSYIKKIEGTHTDVIESRNDFKSKLAEAKTEIETYTKQVEELNFKTKNMDVDKIKSEMEHQYKTREDELRNLLQEKDSLLADKDNKLVEMSFSQVVKENNIYDGFDISNPFNMEIVEREARKKAIYKDGQWFVNDGNGNVAIDVESGKELPLSFINKSLHSVLPNNFKSASVQAQGSGMPQQSSHTQGKKFSDYTSSELVEIKRTNPSAYEQLKQTK